LLVYDGDKYIMLKQIYITHYIISHIQNNAGSSYRNPIKILKEDSVDYVDLEYGIIKAIAEVLKFRYTVKDQVLFFSKRHKVYDIITIEKSDRTVQKYWFDISNVFGQKCLVSN
jgi:hypothetical protein